jgi:hypothetical protein
MADSTEPGTGPWRPGGWLALTAVMLGGLLVAGLGLLNCSGIGADGNAGTPEAPDAAPVPAAISAAEAGTCLDWKAADARDAHPVPCAQPHLFEATGTADLRADFTRSAQYPEPDQWQQLKEQHCTPVSVRYLDGRWDSNGRFSVGAFTPNKEQWRWGDRSLHCGMEQPGVSGELYRFSGKVADLDQSNTYPVGRCLGINGTAVADPVPNCAVPHSVEITGLVNLGARFPDDFPSPSEQDDFLAARCAQLTTRYAGRSAADKGLIGYWDTISWQSWAVGSREVNCKVSAQLPDGTGLAPLTGSIRDEVRIGSTPAPEDTEPTHPGAPSNQPR